MDEKLYKGLSDFFKIPLEKIKSESTTLRDIMEQSDVAVNSVDVMEGFADVLQENDLDEKVDIPVFTLDDKVTDVIRSITDQVKERA